MAKSNSGFKNGLKKVGDVWHYKFKYKGIQYHGSTGMTRLDDARTYLEARKAEVRKCEVRSGDIPTFEALWERYRRDNTRATPVSVQCTANSIVPWVVPLIGKVKVSEIGPQHLGLLKRHYLSTTKCPSRPHTEGGFAKLLTDVRTVLNTVKRYPEFRGIEVIKVQIPKVQEKVITTLPLEQIEDFIAASNSFRPSTQHTLAIRIMLFMGLRISEIISMRWEWFSHDFKTYTPGKTKGREAERLPVFENLIPHIASWRGEAKSLCARMGFPMPPLVFFKVRDPGSPSRRMRHPSSLGSDFWSPQDPCFCTSRINRAARSLNLSGRWGPHKLRHTFATVLVQMGVSNKVVQGLLRHKSPITTERYIHVTAEMRTEAIRRFSLYPATAAKVPVMEEVQVSLAPGPITDAGEVPSPPPGETEEKLEGTDDG